MSVYKYYIFLPFLLLVDFRDFQVFFKQQLLQGRGSDVEPIGLGIDFLLLGAHHLRDFNLYCDWLLCLTESYGLFENDEKTSRLKFDF